MAEPQLLSRKATPINGGLVQAVEEAHSGSYDGMGSSQFRNGNTYQGEFKECTMNGKGGYSWTGLGITYNGDFDRNRMRGKGAYSWPDGSSYEGEVFDGLRHGYGVFTGPHGICRYAGNWRAGRRHGKGRLEYDPRGVSYYEGDWEDDEKHGQGKMVYKSGNVYEGEWVRNVKHGYGEMRWASTAEVYKGQWAGGLQDGLGEHEWLRPQSDGHPLQLRERYAGQWQAGQRSGQGIFVYANGSVYRGGWLANLKHGDGEFFFEDGSAYRGPFEKDHMAKGGVLTKQSPDLLSDLDLSELVRTEKDPELSAQNVANALARFNSEVKRTYRYYAAMHCSTEDAFTLLTEQLDTLLHDTEVATLELPLAVAHRVFFGALLRPGAGQPKPAAPPKPSVEELVRAVLPPSAASAAEEAPSAAADGHVGSAAVQSGKGAAGATPTVAALPATQLHAPTRPILLREFGAGLVRLAHARHPHLPSLAQRLHELLVTNIVPNARAAPTEGASVAERERARAVASDTLENEWPAVRAVCDLFAPKLSPLWLACAKPSQEDTPGHRQARAADETARCREFALLLRRTRLVPPGLDVAQALATTVLWRYGVALASEPDAASEQLALILEIELTHDEFCRGLCRIAMLHHAAHHAALAAELAPAAEDAGSPAADESGVAPAGAPAADATDAGPPPTPAASAPLAEVVEFFFEHRLLPRWEEWRLEQQIKAMKIWEQPGPE